MDANRSTDEYRPRPGAPRADAPRVGRRRSSLLVAVVLALAALGLVSFFIGGCRKDLDSAYGRRHGDRWASVNGTGVLGEMFEQAGHTVFSRQILSPRLRSRADCIVWFPDSFHPPGTDVCQWLDGWLREAPARTLIYVGRDFDAAVWYWAKIQPVAPADQKAEILRRKTEAKKLFLQNLRSLTSAEECEWFTLKSGKHRSVQSLQGSPEWTEGIDPAGLAIELNHRMVPPRDAEVVLESEGDMLMTRQAFGRSRLVVVANGSFLLNLPLVNHEHRKLAGQLIDEIGPPSQTVVFLESGPAGPFVFDNDPAAGFPSGLEILRVWPADWILLHLAAVGIVFCFWRFPIFGRPRDLEPEGTSDFGRHVQALGELLERSGDVPHAAARLAHYRQLARPDTAASPVRRGSAGPADGPTEGLPPQSLRGRSVARSGHPATTRGDRATTREHPTADSQLSTPDFLNPEP